MKYITLQSIKAHNPCEDQYKKACKLFGKRKRIAVSVRLALSVADQFDWDWLAQKFLSATAEKACNEARAPALNAYREARAAAANACNGATAAALNAYNEARAAAWNAYREARAATFARAYLSMKG